MKPLNEIRALKAQKEDELLSKSGVTGVDVGKKITNGKRTDETAIRVYVKKKKKNVAAKDRIPEEIDGVKTDVIEATFELHSVAVPVAEIERKADTGNYDPLVGGISIGPCGAVGGYVYTGTLGCMVKDRDTNEIMMMTNYHVLAEKWPVGEDVCQPSRVDTGSCPSDTVGQLVRSAISEKVDGAVASISGRGHDCSIHEIGDVKGKAVAAEDMAVRKRGRTTGLTHGIVDSIDATVTVPYDDGDHVMKNQIIINVDADQSAQFGNSGDSGSVVVNDQNRVVGLYYAGTSDGSLGVANHIDNALNELNVDLCVAGVFKAIWAEKHPRLENIKWRYPEHWKDRIKEVSYEKPPISETIDWGSDWRVNPPTWRDAPIGGGGPRRIDPITRIEARLAELEKRLLPTTQGTRDARLGRQALNCVDFAAMGTGTNPNPLNTGGAEFLVFDYANNPVAATRIVGWGGFPGLDVNYRTVVTHGPCPLVEVTLVHYADPATVKAYDAAGAAVMSATMTAPQGREETLTLRGGDIVRVEIDAPQNEVILRKYCHCNPAKNPIKEKFESKELKEFKEKPEILEGKRKELKELKEKEKEFKEFKEKEKELKEIYEDFERIPMPFEPSRPWEGGLSLPNLEARLARLEAALGQSHFIGQRLRPDLSRGSLYNEPGYSR